MQKSMFVIEDWFGPDPGYTSGERWNGWATPYVEYDVVLQMVEDLLGQAQADLAALRVAQAQVRQN